MSKSLRCAALAAATVFLIITAILSAPTAVGASAYVAESDFYLTKFETLRSDLFYNAEEGCVYRVPLARSTYENIVKVEYDVVPLNSKTDEIAVDEKNKVTPERDNIEHFTVTKAEMTEYPNKNERKHAYFDITARKQSAFVFTVHYGDGQVAYGSEILYCLSIDSSAPEAYYTNIVYENGAYVFKITINGNKRSDTLSANSGLRSFTVLRRSEDAQWTKLHEQSVNGQLSTTYDLRTVNGRATYYMDIVDNVGNATRVEIVTFTDQKIDGLTTAADNALDDMEIYDYSEKLKSSLREAKLRYEGVLRIENADEEELKKSSEAVREILGYFARLEELRKQGKKEYEIKTLNTEYLGEVDIVNSGAANADFKYGDKANYVITVARFTENEVDRDGVKKFSGVKRAKVIYTLTLALNDGANDVRKKFDEPIIIRIPRELSNVTAAQTADGGFSKVKITVGNGYTDIAAEYSYGTIDIFVLGASYDYLWFLTLIPAAVAAGIAAAVIVKRKKRKNSPVASSDTTVGTVDTDENK